MTTRVSTEEAARSSADGSLTTRVSTEEAARSSADGSIVTAYQSADTSIEGRVSTLEATIMEDVEMIEEIKVGIVASPLTPTVYTLANPVQDNDETLVQVFVNGVKVKCTVAAAANVTVVAPHAIDADDDVTFLYQTV